MLQEALEAAEAGEALASVLARLPAFDEEGAKSVRLAAALAGMVWPALSGRDRSMVREAVLAEFDRATTAAAPRLAARWGAAAGFALAAGVLLAVTAFAAAAVLVRDVAVTARQVTGTGAGVEVPRAALRGASGASATTVARRSGDALRPRRASGPTHARPARSATASSAAGPGWTGSDRAVVVLPFDGPPSTPVATMGPFVDGAASTALPDRTVDDRDARGGGAVDPRPSASAAATGPPATPATRTPSAMPLPAPSATPVPTGVVAAGIAGWVADPDGGPIAEATVRAELLDGNGIAFELTRTDAAGAFVLDLPPGAYRVWAEASGHAGRWFDGAEEVSGALPVVVAGGARTMLVIVLPPALAALPPTPAVAP